jgi:hypothetical protein
MGNGPNRTYNFRSKVSSHQGDLLSPLRRSASLCDESVEGHYVGGREKWAIERERERHGALGRFNSFLDTKSNQRNEFNVALEHLHFEALTH